jgi:uncharacterized protein YbcI
MDEKIAFNMEQKEIENIANEALDEACAYMQKKLGITSGDFASHFFDDGIVINLFNIYMKDEIYLHGMNKDKLIEKLIKDDIKTDFSQEFYDQILRDGFVGYKNQTLEELKTEWLQRTAKQ